LGRHSRNRSIWDGIAAKAFGGIAAIGALERHSRNRSIWDGIAATAAFEGAIVAIATLGTA